MYANGNSVFSSDQCLKQELKKEICSENATSTPSKFVSSVIFSLYVSMIEA